MTEPESMNAYCQKHDLFNCWYCIVTPAVTAALDAAHYPADDPVRRAVGAFDMPNILDEHEAGYDRRA